MGRCRRRCCRLQGAASFAILWHQVFRPDPQIKVALCQLAVTDDKQCNIATARSAIDEAAGAGGEAGPAVVSLSSAAV